MYSKVNLRQPIALLKESVHVLLKNPEIFFPFATMAFIQCLIIEILYFSPCFPLSLFFGPLIFKTRGEIYLHYPYNLILLPQIFRYIQMPIYIFVDGMLIAMAIKIIADINSNRRVDFKLAFFEARAQYVHIVMAAMFSFITFYYIYKLYSTLVEYLSSIQGPGRMLFFLKLLIIEGGPYFNLIIGVLVTTIFAFVLTIIVLEKKKIFAALIQNFKELFHIGWFSFFVILIPTMFYTPIIFLRNNIAAIADSTFPEVRVCILVTSVVIMTIIDAIIYTSLTSYYLLQHEAR